MEGRRWFLVGMLIALLASTSCGRELKIREYGDEGDDRSLVYNHTLAMTLVEYASAVYVSDMTELFTWTCSRCNGLTKGFQVVELIFDVQHCLEAYVGVAQDLNAIVIAFRGTQEHRHIMNWLSVFVSLCKLLDERLCVLFNFVGELDPCSLQNWISDLFWKQLDLDYPGMPDAMVHHGFYSAYHNTTIRSGILNAIKKAKQYYGKLDIMLTGHSMGGAIAAFCALDLVVNCEAENVQLMTFGQPRVGNAVFATYYKELVPNAIRVVNERDIVPHLPPYYSIFPTKTYHHFSREVWLYNLGLGSLVYTVEKVCDDSGEDPTCSRSVLWTSISDHLSYYGVDLCGDVDLSCGIVMAPALKEFSTTDLKGNFVLSRVPASSILKMKTEETVTHNHSL
ncbi:unnamed protein product [Linum tenue]|uniref:Fungal lipase-type domain-containing protein n=1 Tax=Linum tenue TaxID=586396 RepID=A0AAV0P6A2_9ROSI|nr:unnamed protein product [Linum tenue]